MRIHKLLAHVAAPALVSLSVSRISTSAVVAVERPEASGGGYTAPTTSVLSPALLAVKTVGGTLVGVKRTGEPAIRLPEGMEPRAGTAAISELAGFSGCSEVGNAQIDPADELIVHYVGNAKPEMTVDFFQKLVPDACSSPLKVSDQSETGHFIVVKSDHGFNSSEIDAIAQTPRVSFIEINCICEMVEPDTVGAAGDTGDWGLANIHVSPGLRVSDKVLAVVDTGIMLNHFDLQGNIWRNPRGVAADAHGYNFSVLGQASDPSDTDGHGTHCAGIVGGTGINGGVVGVVQQIPLMAVKVFPLLNQPKDREADFVRLAKGIDYAVDNGANVINCSWTGAFGKAVKDSIVRAGKKNVLVVVAAGNGERVLMGNKAVLIGLDLDKPANGRKRVFPAALTTDPDVSANGNLITVASIGGLDAKQGLEQDTISQFSNYGAKTVDIAAPGFQIRSAFLGNKFAKLSGTSMATPFVAGAAAFVWSLPGNKNMTARQIKTLLISNRRKLPGLANKCVCGGTLDLSFAAFGAPGAILPAAPAATRPTTQASMREFKGIIFEPVASTTGTRDIHIKTEDGSYILFFSDPKTQRVAEQFAQTQQIAIVQGEIVQTEKVEDISELVHVKEIKSFKN